MLEKLTHESFAPHDDSTFDLVLEDQTVPLQLVEVSARAARRPQPWDRPIEKEKRQPFSLVFRGPNLPALGQGTYRLEHASIGVIEMLFITPVHEDEQGRFYEAIFT